MEILDTVLVDIGTSPVGVVLFSRNSKRPLETV